MRLGRSNIDLTCELRPRAIIITQARGWRHSCARIQSKNGDKEASQVEIVVRASLDLPSFVSMISRVLYSIPFVLVYVLAFRSCLLCIPLFDPGLHVLPLPCILYSLLFLFSLFYIHGLLLSSSSVLIIIAPWSL